MKVQFFYTSGHSFTANSVISVDPFTDEESGGKFIEYVTESVNGDIYTKSTHEVPIFDLLYAVVSPSHEEVELANIEGDMSCSYILHGAANKFDVQVEVKEQARIVGAAQAEAIVENKIIDFRANEQAKFRARQKRRNEERVAELTAQDDRTALEKAEDEFNSSALAATKFMK